MRGTSPTPSAPPLSNKGQEAEAPAPSPTAEEQRVQQVAAPALSDNPYGLSIPYQSLQVPYAPQSGTANFPPYLPQACLYPETVAAKEADGGVPSAPPQSDERPTRKKLGYQLGHGSPSPVLYPDVALHKQDADASPGLKAEQLSSDFIYQDPQVSKSAPEKVEAPVEAAPGAPTICPEFEPYHITQLPQGARPTDSYSRLIRLGDRIVVITLRDRIGDADDYNLEGFTCQLGRPLEPLAIHDCVYAADDHLALITRSMETIAIRYLTANSDNVVTYQKAKLLPKRWEGRVWKTVVVSPQRTIFITWQPNGSEKTLLDLAAPRRRPRVLELDPIIDQTNAPWFTPPIHPCNDARDIIKTLSLCRNYLLISTSRDDRRKCFAYDIGQLSIWILRNTKLFSRSRGLSSRDSEGHPIYEKLRGISYDLEKHNEPHNEDLIFHDNNLWSRIETLVGVLAPIDEPRRWMNGPEFARERNCKLLRVTDQTVVYFGREEGKSRYSEKKPKMIYVLNTTNRSILSKKLLRSSKLGSVQVSSGYVVNTRRMSSWLIDLFEIPDSIHDQLLLRLREGAFGGIDRVLAVQAQDRRLTVYGTHPDLGQVIVSQPLPPARPRECWEECGDPSPEQHLLQELRAKVPVIIDEWLLLRLREGVFGGLQCSHMVRSEEEELTILGHHKFFKEVYITEDELESIVEAGATTRASKNKTFQPPEPTPQQLTYAPMRPGRLLHNIFGRLPIDSLINAAGVSQYWRHIAFHHSLPLLNLFRSRRPNWPPLRKVVEIPGNTTVSWEEFGGKVYVITNGDGSCLQYVTERGQLKPVRGIKSTTKSRIIKTGGDSFWLLTPEFYYRVSIEHHRILDKVSVKQMPCENEGLFFFEKSGSNWRDEVEGPIHWVPGRRDALRISEPVEHCFHFLRTRKAIIYWRHIDRQDRNSPHETLYHDVATQKFLPMPQLPTDLTICPDASLLLIKGKQSAKAYDLPSCIDTTEMPDPLWECPYRKDLKICGGNQSWLLMKETYDKEIPPPREPVSDWLSAPQLPNFTPYVPPGGWKMPIIPEKRPTREFYSSFVLNQNNGRRVTHKVSGKLFIRGDLLFGLDRRKFTDILTLHIQHLRAGQRYSSINLHSIPKTGILESLVLEDHRIIMGFRAHAAAPVVIYEQELPRLVAPDGSEY